MDEKDSSTNSIRLLQSIEPFSFIQETFLTFVITRIKDWGLWNGHHESWLKEVVSSSLDHTFNYNDRMNKKTSKNLCMYHSLTIQFISHKKHWLLMYLQMWCLSSSYLASWLKTSALSLSLSLWWLIKLIRTEKYSKAIFARALLAKPWRDEQNWRRSLEYEVLNFGCVSLYLCVGVVDGSWWRKNGGKER